jgi:hypothetical protein
MKTENESSLIKNISLIFTAIGLIVTLIYFIDFMVERKVSSVEFLNQVASRIRPSLIFDGNGSILADMGAGKVIRKIEIKNDEVLTNNYNIVITPIEHLNYPPIIESIDTFVYQQSSKRGTGNTWVYYLKNISSPSQKISTPKFRLEIIKPS